ncbi:beta-ketoacyl-[acyl-carrier-protein] synthase family protein [Streptomyces sp. NPDC007851]|uniref:beta-ketoacyl-[acyl-carrier-protein] synthase family protein n=1 Tax=Streptomyces sp. NPDC007851 TaxID=3155008 RepID=UPI0033D83F91
MHATRTGRRPSAAVAITGWGATTPLGGTATDTWHNLIAGNSGVRRIEEPWANCVDVRIAAPLAVDTDQELDRVTCRRTDRCQQVALIAAREAWKHAGTPDVERERLAVVIGTSVGGARTLLNQDAARREKGTRAVSPFTIPMMLPNGPATAVSLDLRARAGVHTPVSACAAGSEALGLAADLVAWGRADVVVAGGADACIRPLSISGFDRIGALARRNDDPAGASRPFAADRCGFVLAEGAAALVLERADHARARGAQILGFLAGHGVTSDGHHLTAPLRSEQARAIRHALSAADLAPADVALVSAHATGTQVGDRTEAEAITEALGPHPAVTAIKSATGHTLGAAGALAAVLTLMAMQESVVPATLNLDNRDPLIELDLVVKEPRRQPVSAALVQAFGFGGQNVVLAFQKHM